MREFLGLTTEWLADYAGVNERRLARMEVGREEVIPDPVLDAIEELYEDTEAVVERYIQKYALLMQSREFIEFPVYRTDAEYHAAHKTARHPARWHRAVARRVADAVPGVVLAYKVPGRVDKRPWLDAAQSRPAEKEQRPLPQETTTVL